MKKVFYWWYTLTEMDRLDLKMTHGVISMALVLLGISKEDFQENHISGFS